MYAIVEDYGFYELYQTDTPEPRLIATFYDEEEAEFALEAFENN